MTGKFQVKNHLVILVILFLTGCSTDPKFESIKFNSEQWINGDRRLRGTMVDSLMADSLLYGKSKSGVIEILGEPTASDTIGPLVYQVDFGKTTGPFGMGGIWLFFLTIEFDSTSNKVINVRCSD